MSSLAELSIYLEDAEASARDDYAFESVSSEVLAEDDLQ